MRLFAIVGALFASACCSSLPKLPAKSTPFPFPHAEREDVNERSEVWHDAKRNRDVPVKIYGDSGPIVIVSHGIGEDRDSYASLGHELARHGFRAVHITHAGTDRAVLERGYRHLYRAVKQKENWVNRPLDVSFVLDRLDANEAAIVGHSAGAFTAFALAGLRMTDGTLRDSRITVAVAMSMPRIDAAVAPGGYDAVAIPVLNLTGTCDTSIIYRTFPRHRRIPFDEARNAYLVTIEGVNHDTFVEEDARIAAIVIAFLRSRAWFEEPGTSSIDGVRVSVERKKETAR